MKRLSTILLFFLLSCEQIVVIPLPAERNLLVVEGWITDINQNQSVTLSSSNSFLGPENSGISDATLFVLSDNNERYDYTHSAQGIYISDDVFQGVRDTSYRLVIVLSNGEIVQSEWTKMLPQTTIVLLSIDDFEENDPDNPGQTETIFFPRITARDSSDFENFYRWVFFKNGELITEPESITLQRDIFFDGNFIPNLFDEFEYALGDQARVELHSIEKETFEFLTQLKAQITASATPADVDGNLTNISNPGQTVLGYFGTSAISSSTAIVE